jgi:DNA replication protein DnaC
MTDAEGMALMQKTIAASPAAARSDSVTTATRAASDSLQRHVPRSPEELAAIADRDEERKRGRAERERQVCIEQITKDLGRRYSHERVGELEKYKPHSEKQRAVVDRLREVLAELPAFVAEGRNLMFFGPVGSGKDHLLACALHQAARRGINCRWRNAQDLYVESRDRMDSGRSEKELLDQLFNPAVLAISDPIPEKGRPTPWNVTLLFRVIEKRYRELKPTWLSLNADAESDIPEDLSYQVFDRLQEDCEIFPCIWESWRARKRRRRAS